jgi:hypothetical protein
VPNAEEQKVIHNAFLQTVDVRDPTIHKRVLPSDGMWMDEVTYSSIIVGQPEVIGEVKDISSWLYSEITFCDLKTTLIFIAS